ncbi:MAG: thiamine pyrophosphate-dependent dehydrogenase E1 component subunit alpha [Kordiimonadaceae bacterium]|nr:thiamine pyrophosphate-dependent dehydrogenase E1 component subunit alpha [Kordiimonadaceae bacterium]
MLQKLHALYSSALRIRAFEQAIGRASDAGEAPGLVHLCLGAEVLQVAICGALDNKIDSVHGSHRSHGLALASGVDPYKLAAEILGREGGLSNGLGGTQHLLAPEQRMASNGIVGAQVPLAAGAALSSKTLNSGGITVAFFGDGAANQGAVLETMNLAVALSLPLLFVLENNGHAYSTSSGYASGGISLAERAKAFGLNSTAISRDDIALQIEQISSAVEQVRFSKLPMFIEAFVPRMSGHYHGDNSDEDAGNGDPLAQLEVHLESHVESLSQSQRLDVTILQQQAATEMDKVVTKALQSPPPGNEVLGKWREQLGVAQ